MLQSSLTASLEKQN